MRLNLASLTLISYPTIYPLPRSLIAHIASRLYYCSATSRLFCQNKREKFNLPGIFFHCNNIVCADTNSFSSLSLVITVTICTHPLARHFVPHRLRSTQPLAYIIAQLFELRVFDSLLRSSWEVVKIYNYVEIEIKLKL